MIVCDQSAIRTLPPDSTLVGHQSTTGIKSNVVLASRTWDDYDGADYETICLITPSEAITLVYLELILLDNCEIQNTQLVDPTEIVQVVTVVDENASVYTNSVRNQLHIVLEENRSIRRSKCIIVHPNVKSSELDDPKWDRFHQNQFTQNIDVSLPKVWPDNPMECVDSW